MVTESGDMDAGLLTSLNDSGASLYLNGLAVDKDLNLIPGGC